MSSAVSRLPVAGSEKTPNGKVAVPVSALRHGRAARAPLPPHAAPGQMAPRDELQAQPSQYRRVQVVAGLGLLVLAVIAGLLLEPQWRGRSIMPTPLVRLVQAIPGVGPWFTAGLGPNRAHAAGATAGLPPPPISPEDLLPASLLDLTPEMARQMNRAMTISPVKSAVAEPFLMPFTDLKVRHDAAQCLTAAIYYEAGQEPPAGQRAVAQVIINRMRHPAYPKSICGVIFQGSERPTGCQFTFSCDGSLRRVPDPVLWRRAQSVAEAALNGWVERSVGLATHYHADYVVPRWASSLVKTQVIGAHIFYRWTGGWGTPAAFGGKWAGAEQPLPGLPAIDLPEGPVLVLASAELAPAAPAAPAPASTGVAETAAAVAPVAIVAPPVVHTAVEAPPPAPVAAPAAAKPAPKTATRPPRLPVPANW